MGRVDYIFSVRDLDLKKVTGTFSSFVMYEISFPGD